MSRPRRSFGRPSEYRSWRSVGGPPEGPGLSSAQRTSDDRLDPLIFVFGVELARLDSLEAARIADALDQGFGRVPMQGFILAGHEPFLESLHVIDDENPAGAEEAAHLSGEPLEIEGMVERVRVDRIHRAVGKDHLVKIAGQDIEVVGSGVEIEPDGELAEAVKGLDLGAEPGAEAEDIAHLLQRLTGGEAAAEILVSVVLVPLQPILDPVQLARLVLKVLLVARIVPARQFGLPLPAGGLELLLPLLQLFFGSAAFLRPPHQPFHDLQRHAYPLSRAFSGSQGDSGITVAGKRSERISISSFVPGAATSGST